MMQLQKDRTALPECWEGNVPRAKIHFGGYLLIRPFVVR